VELAAERTKAALEIHGVERQLSWKTEEREVIAVAAERKDLRTRRAEVRLERRTGTARAADWSCHALTH
jgi:hypothetical protein